ncbi:MULTISPECIES: succinylglutamate desuccinylase/aspartoacylase family protein [unclassified Massilia]|uniref:succinylglutamate desuccinylase/aspartoacylase family protein n=1 Tax=unclassified Massilia TaxID=2609279 RepID=UPI00177E60D4|nr:MULTISPECIES: succinylglutamate desuccinylase/aspartoacylase family protein [unclassified Massilia]MBD8532323.1 succinylglutamate desuccinylase/aspartoacylase family protein [Massilia sp. CFBP 13647]MBD8673804.1 succinylglutamate desuccinylase/aspartoacylase family protein [Massilia sp. CFBP 13721]
MASAPNLQFKFVNYTGLDDGPSVIIMGATHGNEICGTEAIRRVMAELDSGALRIAAGSVTFVPIVNPLAYFKNQRNGDRNLNRNLFPKDDPQDFEDRIANWLCPLLAQHDVLLDLHSFNAAHGEPFVMVGPVNNDGPLEPFVHADKERALARRLGVRRFVTGWMAAYGGGVQRRSRGNAAELETVLRYGVGTTEYMRSTGGYALTLECGQHVDPQAPEVAYRAIINTLAHLALIEAPQPEPVPFDEMEALHMVAVYDKLDAGDSFVRSWASFDPVTEGEQIGTRADGTPVLAEFSGRILFPDAKAGANSEWYYLTRANPEFGRG